LSIRTELVTAPARFYELEAEWNALWERAGADIFQTFAWIRGWVDGQAREQVRLLIGLAWRDDRLIAVLPFAVQRRGGLRVLQWAAQMFSDYCDALVDPEKDGHDALEKIWDHVHRAGGFDLLMLQQVRPDAAARRLLDGMARSSGARRMEAGQEKCLRIDCAWPSGEAWFRSLNKKARNNHTRGKRILSELGGEVVFRMHDSALPVAPVIEEIFQLKQAWLRVHHPDSPLLDRDAGLARNVLNAAWQSGHMVVFLLECGGRIAAASINFVYNGRMQAYVTSYDPAFDRASPGTILIVDYTKWAFDRGIRSVDFLRGDEAFKFRLANAETVLDGYLGARTLLGRVALAARDIRTRLRARRQTPPAELPHDEPEPEPSRAGGC